MNTIEQNAYLSVGRACGFAGLGIMCFMVGLSFEPLLAAKSGGTLVLLMTVVLAYRAMSAPGRPYKRTETWLMLEEADRPTAATAQQLIGEALRGAYLWYAQYCAAVAIVLWTTVLILALLG
jgi:hypothetical protein